MRKLVIGLAMASTALASPALARDGQWYVEVGGGPMLIEDVDFNVNDGAGEVTADTKEGYDFGGVVGYDFGAFRLEAEASYREGDIDNLVADAVGIPRTTAPDVTPSGTFPARGDINVLSFMMNGLFDFGPDDGLQGYFGGGIGVARTDAQACANPRACDAFNDSDTGLAWQALAGVRAPLSDSWDVGLRYRLFTAENLNIVDRFGRGLDGKFRSHSLMGTLTYNFGGEPEAPPPPPVVVAPPPPVVAPPPPVVVTPPPPPACNKGPYIVFFEWDQSDITPEAANILNNAVAAYANCGSASVMLAGHTDTSGSMTYNNGLAERRNASVTDYLAGRGIPAGRISSEGFGETQLRVPTDDGVREPQNRRVEVNYGPNAGM
ncbi:outer membrane beta-barrel protein [Pontixanthobacter aestiaquae]|uniref:OmpA family protein n=1 Tax=Pontixanthobacter aestiaquae TaxID=1509367 RepID=A0A844Z2P0_9SPHN|nr:OmpA family protein [Pontixanthobacter aestiaquae]MDN3647074.1 outer membrane beta-barrel protein [Pontixanthobacter aestiaquae]MXO81948.1 OmpA family protein [Pontixanthobacter aestiaquae]